MNKIWLIIQREYLTKVKKKSFLVMTILGPLLFGGFITGGAYLAATDTSIHDILIIDQKGWIIEDEIAPYADKNVPRENFVEDENTHFYFSQSPVDVNKELESGKYSIIVEVDSAAYADGKCTMSFTQAPSLQIQNRIQTSIEKSIEKWNVKKKNMSYSDYKSIRQEVVLMLNNIKDSQRDERIYMRAVLGFVTALIIYIFILLYGLQVMRGVMEEKTSRIVEVIISSVKPFQLMMGKIIGIGLVGVTQFLIWIVLSGIIGSVGMATFIGKQEAAKQVIEKASQNSQLAISAEAEEMSNMNPSVLEFLQTTPWVDIAISFLFFFIGGFLLYGSMYAAIGAAVDQEADTQQFQMPVTIPLIFGYLVSVMMMENPEGTMGDIFSIVPFTSPIVMMVKTAIGVDLWVRLVSMTVLILSFIGITWLAGRIYRVGILMYGKKPTYKELWKWIRYSG